MDIIGKLNDLTNGNLLLWKVVLATIVMALAGLQVAMAAGFYEVATVPGGPATATKVHRVSGRIAIALAVVVAFTCLAGPAGPTSPTRVLLHSVFGTLIFVLLAAKFAILKLTRSGGRALPFVGIALFLTFGAVWATSVADYVAAR
jgi:uncharacterized protein DUF6529